MPNSLFPLACAGPHPEEEDAHVALDRHAGHGRGKAESQDADADHAAADGADRELAADDDDRGPERVTGASQTAGNDPGSGLAGLQAGRDPDADRREGQDLGILREQDEDVAPEEE